jgi:peptidylprolyl isomerase
MSVAAGFMPAISAKIKSHNSHNLEDTLKSAFYLGLLMMLFLGSFVLMAASGGGQTPKTIPAPDDVAAPPKDAQKTSSGLVSKVLTPGTGKEHPKATSQVTVHYTGWTTDGKMFDSSVMRGQPATFPLDRVIKGWTEGVQLMVVGEKRRFWIPGNLAYDGSNRPDAPKGMLVFDIELLGIK